MLNGWNIMVQALACISNITKGVKCEEICNLQSGYYSGIGDYADCLHHPDRRKELRGAVMVVVSIKMGRPKIGRRCTNPACDNWFAPGKHNPEQRFCSSQCAIQARRAKSERITERFYEQPHKQLACAVIQQAVQEWKYDRNSKKDPDYVLWVFSGAGRSSSTARWRSWNPRRFGRLWRSRTTSPPQMAIRRGVGASEGATQKRLRKFRKWQMPREYYEQ